MKITLGEYIDGNSILHKMDPRVKITLLIILIIALFALNIYLNFIFFSLLIFILIYISKIPLKSVLRSLKPMYWILLVTFFTNPFFHDGDVIFSYSILNFTISVTIEGIIIGITMTYRLIILMLLSSFLTLTTKTIRLADAVEDLCKPLKVFNINPHIIAMIISLGLRFVPTTVREFEKITKAQKSRGVRFENISVLKKIKNFIPIIFPLILLTFQRADELSMAMEARCYTENKTRTLRKKLRVTRTDYSAILFVSLFIILMIILNFVVIQRS